MPRTIQQQYVIDTVKRDDVSLVKVKAVAGAGKTFTLVELAKELQPANGMYLAYNKAIANEATVKFKGTNIKCSTIHSLAYQNTVKQLGLKVGFFTYRDIRERIPYRRKVSLVDDIEQFCLSGLLDPKVYASAQIDKSMQKYFLQYMDKMATGEVNCTHSFYLKMFHVLLHTGEIILPEYDLLLMDEAGDITELTLAIFKLLKATKKVAVGDPLQNIYSFNNTINAFTALEDEGIEANLTESFRVSDTIASRIQTFIVNKYMDDFIFTGRKYTETIEGTKAYIARTNTGLIGEMLRLKEKGTAFKTTRNIDTILELPLILANINSGNKITNYQYKFLEKLRSEYENTALLQSEYKSASSYVRSKVSQDMEVVQAFKVVLNYGPKQLNCLAKYVRECAKKESALTLTTAHSSKGLEFNEVEIAPDLNQVVTEALTELSMIDRDSEDYLAHPKTEELRLYYVACSRAMTKLHNAEHL